MKSSLTFFLAVSLVVAGTASLEGQGRGRGRGNGGAKVQTAGPVHLTTVVFREADRPAFRDYFVAHRVVGRPLPPGIAKNLQRGKPLPPGIAKRALPIQLVRVSPRPYPDITYFIVGDRVVALRHGIVIDIMLNIF